MACGADGVYRDFYATAGAVLEADGHAEARSELAVHLAFGGTCTDGSPRDGVRQILRRDGVEELGTCGHAALDEIEEQCARDTQDRKSTRLNSSHVAISYAV